jgi:hypothetical protein
MRAFHQTTDELTTALRANGGETWVQKYCECDHDVGAVPCRYCAIHNALTHALERHARENAARDALGFSIKEENK